MAALLVVGGWFWLAKSLSVPGATGADPAARGGSQATAQATAQATTQSGPIPTAPTGSGSGSGAGVPDVPGSTSTIRSMTVGTNERQCPIIPIVASEQLVPLLRAQADAVVAAGTCAEFTITAVTMNSMIDTFRSAPGNLPPVWVSDSPVWVSAAKAVAPAVSAVAGPEVATTPVVLAVPSKLSSPATTGVKPWLTALKSLPLAVSSPLTDTATALMFTTIWQQLATSPAAQSPLSQAYFQAIRSSSTQQALLAAGASDSAGAKAFPATEQQIITTNRTHPRTPLGALVPAEGVPSLRYQLVRIGTHDERVGAAITALQDRLTGDDGKQALRAAGFRVEGTQRSGGSSGQSTGQPTGQPTGTEIVPAVLPEAPQPDPSRFTAIITDWKVITRDINLLAVVDVSGSMKKPAGRLSRIQLATRGVNNVIGLLRPSSRAGLWVFSAGQKGKRDFRPLVGIGKMSATGQRGALLAASATMPGLPKGGTGLYDTVWGAYQNVQRRSVKGMDNVVVILTDGRNDDTTGGITRARLLKNLRAAQDPARPVRIIMIGMGSGTDVATLRAIAQASNGRHYVATNPASLPSVFASAMWSVNHELSATAK